MASLYLGFYGTFREKIMAGKIGTYAGKGFAGSVAGISAAWITWSFMIPVDTIKTQVQVSNDHNIGAQEALRKIRARPMGILDLWSGLLPVYGRACAIPAPAMFAYETVR